MRDRRADFFGLLGGSREVEARLFQAACDVEDMAVGGARWLFSSSFKLSTLATMLSLAREVREMPMGVAEDGRSREPGF